MSFIELVSKSVRRRLFRNVALVLCFAFVTSSLISANFLVDGAENSVQAGLSRLGADIMVVPTQYDVQSQSAILMGTPSTFTFSSSVENEVANVSGVQSASPQLYISTLSDRPCCSGAFQLIGIDPNNDFTIAPWLENQLKGPLGKDQVIVGSKIIGSLGSTLMFYGQNFTIVGRLEPTGMGVDSSIFLRMEDAYAMAATSSQKAVETLNITTGEISAVLVRLDPETNANDVAARIMLSVPGTDAVPSAQFSKQVSDALTPTTNMLYATTAAVTLISLPLVALVSSMVANERRRELGLLRAMGATKGFVFSLVFVEALLLAIIGGVIGVGVTSLVIFDSQAFISSSLQIPFLWPPLLIVIGESAIAISLAVIVGAISSLYPAYRSSSMEPYDAIRRGEN